MVLAEARKPEQKPSLMVHILKRLLNTSLNINEPISNISEDTVKTFLNSRIDVLVVENYLIIRKQ